VCVCVCVCLKSEFSFRVEMIDVNSLLLNHVLLGMNTVYIICFLQQSTSSVNLQIISRHPSSHRPGQFLIARRII
jgi:hypothetical protein